MKSGQTIETGEAVMLWQMYRTSRLFRRNIQCVYFIIAGWTRTMSVLMTALSWLTPDVANYHAAGSGGKWRQWQFSTFFEIPEKRFFILDGPIPEHG